MRKLLLVSLALIAPVLLALAHGTANQATPQSPQSCEALAQLSLSDARILLAQEVAAGTFMPPASGAPPNAGEANFYKTLPAFCRVTAEATPSADSSIKIEVWMPAKTQDSSGWNGRFHGQGNGGFAGSISYRALGLAVKQGYAVTETDTGHSGEATDASWALRHPEKIVDFGYRAIHEMTRVSKAAIKAYYGKGPQHSYFAGCSNGGRQALMEAQRFPEDYDGILAGAPANFWTHLLTSALFDAKALTADPGDYIPSSKLPAIARAVNAACDAQDGVIDGILNDPRKCHFDPAVLLCAASDSDSCLTARQVATLTKLYAGARDSRGREIFPGFMRGAEDVPGSWNVWITGAAPGRSLLFAFGNGFFTNMVYGKADWNYRDADLDQALAMADTNTARDLNATDLNLTAFKAHGGKLILYHGWDDPAISALNTTNYYDSVVGRMGTRDTEAFLRLYMVPGMLHCGGGPGTDSFGQSGGPELKDAQHNVQLSLEQWVEKGSAPAEIVATKFQGAGTSASVRMTRPLCPYPQEAKYKGGDSNDASSFVCSTGDAPAKKK
jgi:hypothetical protein